jgi:hypothetical protein
MLILGRVATSRFGFQKAAGKIQHRHYGPTVALNQGVFEYCNGTLIDTVLTKYDRPTRVIFRNRIN